MSHDAILRHKASHYQYLNDVIKQVSKLTKQYTELRPDVKFFTHNNGTQDNLVNLNGTIPVFYKQRQYNIPIVIWLYDKHPMIAPMVFVQPTTTMVIRQGRHVDASGKVYLPYLSEWKAKKSDLVGLVGILCTVFGLEPPVVAKPPGAPSRPAQQPIRSASMNNAYPPQYPIHPPSFQSQTGGYPSPSPQYRAPYPSNVQGPPGPGYIPPRHANPPYPTGGAFPSHPPTSNSGPVPYPQSGPPQYSYSTPQVQSQPNYGQSIPGVDNAIIMASVRDSVNDTLKRRATDIILQLNGELNTLRVTENELKLGKSKIDQMNSTIEQEKQKCNSSISSYQNQLDDMNQEISNLESGNKMNPEDIITPSTPIYKQIFHSHAQEQAIEDAIYFISKALSRGSIDCETFLRYVRRLSRQQFEMKETVIKAREAARI